MRFLAPIIFLASAAAVHAQAPAAPTNLKVDSATGGAVKLSWTASVPGDLPPDGYLVYRAPAITGDFVAISNFGTVPTPAYTDSTGTSGTTYRYMVRAYRGTSEVNALSPDSNVVSATPVSTPGAPTNLRQVKVTGTSATIQWNSVSGATSYIIYQDDEEVGEVNAPTTTFTATGLTAETSYTFVVTALSSGGESGDSNTLNITTTAGDGSGRAAAWARKFRLIDTNGDKSLTLEEYARKQAARQAWVIAAHRYEYMDYDGKGGVDLNEYAKALGGRKFFSPSKPRKFLLADGDDSGDLDVSEFALTLNSKLKPAKVQKMFDKKDKNGSEFLSEIEFGIKGGSDYDNGEGGDGEEEEEGSL